MIPVRVLNLPRDGERREWMASHLREIGVVHSWFDAIDGRTIPEAEAAPHRATFKAGHGRDMTPGELGCALSYLQMLREIAAGSDPFVCILEDDIEVLPDVLPFLEISTLRLMPRFDLLRLFSHDHRQLTHAWETVVVHGRSAVAALRTGWGTNAQVVSREGAAKLVDRPITGPIDGMFYYDNPPFGLRILEMRPSLVRLHDFGSNTVGWDKVPLPWAAFIKKRLHRPVRARAHFVATWGLRGIWGLLRSRYRGSRIGT
jgi:GR25 family glycosyltransferase involved in LPS biosynthesis